jgi:hypothetical protein
MAALERWSAAEGATDRFQEFVAEKKRVQRRSTMVRRPRRTRKI